MSSTKNWSNFKMTTFFPMNLFELNNFLQRKLKRLALSRCPESQLISVKRLVKQPSFDHSWPKMIYSKLIHSLLHSRSFHHSQDGSKLGEIFFCFIEAHSNALMVLPEFGTTWKAKAPLKIRKNVCLESSFNLNWWMEKEILAQLK